MHGIIDRRMLVNFRVNPEVVKKLSPSQFRPKLVKGWAMTGICFIRLKELLPHGFPAAWGMTSENAAHRIAVEWDAGATAHEGVFVPRRDTSSRFQTLVGARLFPGAMVLANQRNSVFPVLRRLVRLRLGGRMANGNQFVSWIHENDFCRAVEWIIARDEMSGVVNLVSPNPVTNREMMRTLRQICGVPFGLSATRWMLEVGAFFLRTETELILKSRRVAPGRLLASGFQFRFPHLRDAFQDLSSKT